MVARQHAGDILDADQDAGSSSCGCVDFTCCKKISLYCGDRYFTTVGIETVTAVETHLIEILDGSHSRVEAFAWDVGCNRIDRNIAKYY